MVTIPNGVDLRRLEPRRGRAATRAALGVPADATAVLSLGALTWEKDPVGHLDTSAPVLAHHAGRRPPVRRRWTAVGQELAAAADRLGVTERVRLLGSRDDVADLLASDLLLFASRTEGMPASVIEAGAAGVPVAGTALAGVPEVVVDGETGLLAAPGDRDGLRAALDRLLGDGELRAPWAGRGALPRPLRHRRHRRRLSGPLRGTGGGGMRGVLIVIKGLGRGGAEQLLASSAPYLDRALPLPVRLPAAVEGQPGRRARDRPGCRSTAWTGPRAWA